MSIKEKLHEIIFEADTPAGKLFDLVLLVAILVSVILVILESVESLRNNYEEFFSKSEWTFTIIFSLEYVLRIIITKKPLRYIFSFYGMVDLLSVLPSYIGFIVTGSESLLVIRSIRLIRVFRILKLSRYIGEADMLWTALMGSKRKILVFLFAVITATLILGTIMYMVEGAENGFTSIPRAIYWAIVTLTTVGYGDISPGTTLGQLIASVIMILGYGIIAIPTGIVGTELLKTPKFTNTQVCNECHENDHLDKAIYCHRCGHHLKD